MSDGPLDVTIGELKEEDLPEASRIVRLAYGTREGLPDPMQVFGDRDFFSNRWRAHHDRVLGAFLSGNVVGSNVVSRWGTFGWFGPLAVRPDLWDKGIASRLLDRTMEMFSRWGTTHHGLTTSPGSPKHLGLYGKFGFHARFLTPIMKKRVAMSNGKYRPTSFETFSGLMSDQEKHQILGELMELSDRIYPGLDLSDAIIAVARLGLGDTIVVKDGSTTVGFAVCQHGAGTEGGAGNCYVKFGAVQPGTLSDGRFDNLISAIEGYAVVQGLTTVEAGVNLGRRRAYKLMIDHGYQTEIIDVAMEKPNTEGFNREDVLVIDDWR